MRKHTQLTLTETERRVNVLNTIGFNFIEPNEETLNGRSMGCFYGDVNLVNETGAIAAVYAFARTNQYTVKAMTRREMAVALRKARHTCDLMGDFLFDKGVLDHPRRFRQMFTAHYLNLTAYWNDPQVAPKLTSMATAGLPPTLEKYGYGDLTLPRNASILGTYLADSKSVTDNLNPNS